MTTVVTAIMKTIAHEPSSTIALKTLTKCNLYYTELTIYRIIQNAEILHGNKLSDIKEIGKGRFGSVYLATWLDDIRKVDNNDSSDSNDENKEHMNHPALLHSRIDQFEEKQ
ncbi:hypothetical protein C2G38_2213225 [Gigaspora rosea]|uniref:Protein kinase domain-containing protein n=1 Tax=Gigaspora rosea TaxID=44941 RepID=A0A397UL35_9GLOM|nr:hypothetical protein C2G38_2213225 [Gigaspora rosea]